jgi:hypothetical protein
VGVEETGVALRRDGDNGDLGAIGGDQHVTEDNSRRSDELAVGIDVVVGGKRVMVCWQRWRC